MLIRRNMVEEIGFLDKNMKFICSDSDYSFTARSRGWQVHVVPSARCEHTLGSSSHRSVGEIDKIKIEDVIYFYEKWISGDLYCRISYEGEGLLREDLAHLINDLRGQIRNN
jgi:GT2 family glycosyltransferase